jgi:ketosteroid isomerase-like protein
VQRALVGNAFAEAYASFLAGDPRSLIGLLAADVVYHLPGRHLGGGVLRGRDALLQRLGDAARWCEQVRVELLAVAAAGVFVVTIERMHARREAQEIDQDVCVLWRFDGSQCVEVRATFADQAACDDFWREFRPERD